MDERRTVRLVSNNRQGSTSIGFILKLSASVFPYVQYTAHSALLLIGNFSAAPAAFSIHMNQVLLFLLVILSLTFQNFAGLLSLLLLTFELMFVSNFLLPAL